MADESVPLSWVLLFLLLTLGAVFLSLQFIGADVLTTVPVPA